MIIGLADEAETMVTHSINSTMVSVMRIEPVTKKDVVFTKRMGIKLRWWKTFTERIDDYLGKADSIHDGNDIEVRDHLGGGLHVTMSKEYPFLQFREFYYDETDTMQPGRRGIRITFDELAELKSHVLDFNQNIPELDMIKLCERDHDTTECKICKLRK